MPSSQLSLPGDPSCPLCQGSGSIPSSSDSEDTKQCRCAFAMAVKRRLGEEICLSKPIRTKSPLYGVPTEGGVPLVDLSQENLFIKCWWRDFKSHFRWVALNLLERRNFQWYWQFITDGKIKDVFVGNEAYKVKKKDKRDEVVSFNSLTDLVGDSFDLVVIRLGYLGYKNVAMPGALKETLLIRQAMGKPTWVLEQPSSIYAPGHFAWSQETSEFISEHFKELDLVETHGDEDMTPTGVEGSSLPSIQGISIDETPTPRRVRRPVVEQAEDQPQETPSDILVDSRLFGSGKSSRKPKRGGGGPI